MVTEEQAIRRIIIGGLLLALTLLLVFTRIGLIPMPTPAGNATVAHIPAIIAGILGGPTIGLVVGLGFGFASFMNATVPMFRDPIVAILPRLFIGVSSAYVYAIARRASRQGLLAMLAVLVAFLALFSYEMALISQLLGVVGAVVTVIAAILAFRWMRTADVGVVAVAFAAAAGSLTNTVLVLGAATLRAYIPAPVAAGIGVTHGIPEVVVSAILTVAVVAALGYLSTRESGSKV